MAQTIIEHLKEDHDKVREMFGRLDDTSPEDREELFHDVVFELARHEAAEQALVHPRTRDADQGDKVADSVIREEQEAEQMMAEMEDMDPESDEFLDMFGKLRTAVLNHADHEERTEFPRIEELLTRDEQVQMAKEFERLEETGPTRPHPKTPNDPATRAVMGPIVGIFDRARDAARAAMKG